ncbi:MAG: hypothetical protein ACPGSM_19110 [Thiolinea sp.]
MKETDKQWALNRVEHINQLQNPTDNQKLFVKLVELEETDHQQRAALNALLKHEKRMQKAEETEAAALGPVGVLRERAARNRGICRDQLGDWVLEDWEKEPVLKEWVLRCVNEKKLSKAKQAAFKPLVDEIKNIESSSADKPTDNRPAYEIERERIIADAETN